MKRFRGNIKRIFFYQLRQKNVPYTHGTEDRRLNFLMLSHLFSLCRNNFREPGPGVRRGQGG